MGHVFSGWTIPPEAVECSASIECVIMLKWESLDEMYDVKNDEGSLYSSAFVPLKNEASEGSQTVLYTKIREARAKHAICLIM